MGVLSETATYSVVFVTLPIFAFVAVMVHGFNLQSILDPGEEYLSARKTQGWSSLGLSFFASAIGNWLLYTPPLVGAKYSLWGIFGYAIGSVIPFLILMWLGPVARDIMGGSGFTGSDLMRDRYGRVTQAIVGLLSLLYMWLCMVSELTTIAFTLQALTKNLYPVLAAVIPVAVVTLLYTMYSGLRSPIVTDRMQGVLVLLFMIIAVGVTIEHLSLSCEGWIIAVKGNDNSIIFGSVILLSTYPAELCNQGTWQRIWASRSDRDVRFGLLLGCILIMSTVLLFGFMGLLSKASNPVLVEPSVAFFALLSPLGEGWLVIVAIMALCLVASSVDTLQCGMVAMIGKELLDRKLSMNWTRLASLVLNIPAIVVASYLLDILQLFLMADIICMISLGPILLSAWAKTTNVGAIGGCVGAMMTALICGWVSSKSFLGGFIFLYPDDVASISYLITFIFVPLVSVLVTAGLSYIDVKFFNPEKWEKEVAKRKQRVASEVMSSMKDMEESDKKKMDTFAAQGMEEDGGKLTSIAKEFKIIEEE